MSATPPEAYDRMGPDLRGVRVDRYVLEDQIAIGGMGAVYRATMESEVGGRTVALKIIHPHLAQIERFRKMFVDEVRVVSSIQHQNIGAVIDFGVSNGTPFLVMEWLHGQPLSRVIAEGHRSAAGLPAWLAVRSVVEAARGLHAAHELRDAKGQPLAIVHRDVSPSNIHVLFSGAIKVIDFGIARARGRLTDATAPGEVRGKVAYMAPEQIRGEGVDRRIDVWALGVVLWEGLTGRRLFRADTDATTMLAVLTKDIPPVTAFVPDIPDEVELVVSEALARDPEERLGSALELADRLENYLYSLGRPSGPSQVSAWMQENFEAELRSGFVLADDISSSGLVSSPTAAPADTEARTESTRPLPDVPDAVAPDAPAVAEEVPSKRGARFATAAVLLIGIGLGVGGVFALRDAPPPAVAAAAPSDPAAPVVAAEVEASSRMLATPEPVAPDRAETDPDTATDPNPDSDTDTEAEPDPGDPDSPGSADGTETVPAVGESMGMESMESMRPRRATGPPGTVNVVAVPAAEVRYRSRRLGRTPLVRVEMPPGSHRLTFVWPDGTRRRVPVRVRSGQLTRVGPIHR